jgi:hypothetical protein
VLVCFLVLGVLFRRIGSSAPIVLTLFFEAVSRFRYNRNITMPKTKSNHHAALLAIEKVLTLLRSVHTLEGTDKDGVEHLLEMAVDHLREK